MSEKKEFTVAMPFTGVLSVAVEADNEDDAIQAFWDKLEEDGAHLRDPEHHDVWCDQIEYCEHICEGNFFHGCQNDVIVYDD